jgi:hypothetical protein
MTESLALAATANVHPCPADRLNAGLDLLLKAYVTTSTPGMREQVRSKGRIPLKGDGLDDVYARNIQVADLNMVNAGLAVMRWKRLRGFYRDLEDEHFSLFTLDGNHLLNEDRRGEAA